MLPTSPIVSLIIPCPIVYSMSDSQTRDDDNNKQPTKEDDADTNMSKTIGDEADIYSTADGTRHLERTKEKDPKAPVERNS